MLSKILVVVALLPSTVMAQAYGDAPGCARFRGEPATTDNLIIWDGFSVQRHESSCPVTQSQQVGSGGILLTVSCSGEGETWEDYYLLATTSDPDLYLISRSDSSDPSTEIRRCE